jgi:pimeloyl-ACP methyl ester carboxylesterase
MGEALEPVRVPTPLGAVAVHVLGAGLPTVLWHALFVDGSSWGYVLPQLLPGRRLLIVDGPGWGRSDRPRGPLRTQDVVRAAAAVAGVLAPGSAVDWVGNGWGGHVGLQLAVNRPGLVRSLVTVSAAPERMDPARRRRLAGQLALLRMIGPVGPAGRTLVADLLSAESCREPATVGAVLDALMLAGRLGAARSATAFELRRPDLTDLLPELAVPSLFVSGAEDPGWSAEAAERAASLAPFARAATVDGSGMLVPLDQPRALATLVREFWGSLEHPA